MNMVPYMVEKFKRKKTYSKGPGSSVYNYFHVQLFIHLYFFNFEPFLIFGNCIVIIKINELNFDLKVFLLRLNLTRKKKISRIKK